MRRKEPKEEPDCCFNCRSFSPRHGRKGFGYCMKFFTNRKPKEICDSYSPEYKRRGHYV